MDPRALSIVGRLAPVIIFGSGNVCPRGVESVSAACPDFRGFGGHAAGRRVGQVLVRSSYSAWPEAMSAQDRLSATDSSPATTPTDVVFAAALPRGRQTEIEAHGPRARRNSIEADPPLEEKVGKS